jgi:peptide/nickel transport system ATP-binding protein
MIQESPLPQLLTVSGLSTYYNLPRGTLKAVDGVDLSLDAGQTLALVGESGCGKSATALSIMRLVSPPGNIVAGSILFNGRDLRSLSENEMRHVRGNQISMIFQEPMTALNPVLTIGAQVAEGISLHQGLSNKDSREQAIAILGQTGIPAPAERYNDYPHQMSGGLRQRVIIAMALACRPQLLIADEPTTALDVTIQAQILELLDELKAANSMGMILVSHDLGIVAERSHHTAIMYAGNIVEYAPTGELFANPLHPYTQGLLDSLPQNSEPGKRLKTIPGSVPNFIGDLPGCGFCDRCPTRMHQCDITKPELKEVGTNHLVRCHKFS